MLQNNLELFVSNAQTIKKEFTWQNSMTKRFAALLYAQEGKQINCRAIRDCHNIIKRSVGVFSSFRGSMVLCVAAMLSLSPNPQGLFDETLAVYDLLKDAKFRASDYLVVAAFLIAKQTKNIHHANAVKRSREFYDGIKAHNYFRTGHDDYIFATMFGITDLDVSFGIDRVAWLYDRLKGEFWDKNSVQALAQVLVLGGSGEIESGVCGGGDIGIGVGVGGDSGGGGKDSGGVSRVDDLERLFVLRDAFKERKFKLDRSYTLPSLGILYLLPVDIDTLVHGVVDAMNYFKEQKGFSPLSITKQELLLYAVASVANEYIENIKDGILTATLSTSIANLIIAQQIAMIAAMNSQTAAIAASSSHGS